MKVIAGTRVAAGRCVRCPAVNRPVGAGSSVRVKVAAAAAGGVAPDSAPVQMSAATSVTTCASMHCAAAVTEFIAE